MKHRPDCPCVNCNPVRCADCNSANPYLSSGVCRHRRACEARQMLAAGASPADAATHAQRLPTEENAS